MTVNELKAINSAHQMGNNSPVAASGIITLLYTSEKPRLARMTLRAAPPAGPHGSIPTDDC